MEGGDGGDWEGEGGIVSERKPVRVGNPSVQQVYDPIFYEPVIRASAVRARIAELQNAPDHYHLHAHRYTEHCPRLFHWWLKWHKHNHKADGLHHL